MVQKRVVVSQSMYFPWVGLLEQVRLADVFVHYDDVQFSKGSFTNRVQIKQTDGSTAWMTVPLRNLKLGQRIDEVTIQDPKIWVPKHMAMLRGSFAQAPYAQDALSLAEHVLTQPYDTIAELARASLLALTDYFGLTRTTRFVDCTSLSIEGASSQRVLDVVKALGGSCYITGHGARNYLDHQLFEQSGVSVQYMQYRCISYQQLYGDFTPYVTALDLVANCGPEGVSVIQSESVNWKDFMRVSNEQS
jgi:hypothetical protein